MEIYVFDNQLNFKGILENYFSLRWVRKYSKTGDFEIHCGFKSGMLDQLKPDDIIWKNDDLESGYIVSRELKLDAEGKESLVLKGQFMTGLLGRRIVWGIENLTGTVESGIRSLITKNAINPTNQDRKLSLIDLGASKNFTETMKYQNSYGNLLEQVETLTEAYEYGYKGLLDIQARKVLITLYKGLDRSSSNGINPPAIFANEFDNVLEQEYMDSVGDFKNVSLIAGEGEGNDRKLETFGYGIGLNRHELYVDARDLQSTKGEANTLIPELEYRQMLRDRGNSKLSESKKVEVFNSRVDLNSNLVYKEDYDLGDIVTCTSRRWNLTTDVRITEIEEVYEESGKTITVVFGKDQPTVIEKIKREVK